MTLLNLLVWAILGLSLTLGRVAAKHEGLTLSLVDALAYAEEKGELFGHHARNVYHVATQAFQEQDIVPLGSWDKAANGRQKWQWKIHSPGAQSHLLIFSEIMLPETGVVELCPSRQATAACQRYTPQDIPSSRRLVVPVIPGDSIFFRYEQQDPQQILRLRLASVMQGLPVSLAELQQQQQRAARRRLLAAASAPMSAPRPGPVPARSGNQQQQQSMVAMGPVPSQQALGTQFDIDSMQRTTDDVSQCTPNVECANYKDEAAAVVDIYAIDLRLGAMGLCTGTILNAPLGKKYLLTADHCFIDKQDISNFQWWLLIFNYEMPCRSNATPGPIREVIQGTKLLFYDSKSDVLLLDIPESIPDHFNAYKVGFDAAEEAPARAVAIHHPAGNIKRISCANSSSDISTHFSAPQFSEDIHPTDETHYQVQWTQGATQPGSSGAALIDADTRKVVGVLTGGTTSCSIFSGSDYFGKLSVAWQNGLQNFLSDAPSLLHGAGLDTVTEQNDGVVVVDSMAGSPVREHGPAANFWPSVFVLGPSNTTRIAFYLTDPPAANETITAQMSLRGDLPGNSFNPVANISLSMDTFNFTTENCCTNAQPLLITSQMGDDVPGDLVRFQVVFWLTSNINASYLHVSTVKGVVQSGFESWNTLQPMRCLTVPCNFKDPILSTAPPTSPLPDRAVFQYTPPRDTAIGQDICLQSGVLELSTVSVYINGTFTWTLSEAYDQPDCVHIPPLDVEVGIPVNTIVSDSDDYDAVLPLSIVKSIDMYEGARRVYSSSGGSGAAAVIAAAEQNGKVPVHSASVPISGEAAAAQPARSAPAVSTGAGPTTSPGVSASSAGQSGSSLGGGSSDSDAGTGIGVDSSAGPASSASGGRNSPAQDGSSGQSGQQGQSGGGLGVGAGGFEAGTGIGAAGPDSIVSAASVQAPPPTQQESGKGNSPGGAVPPAGSTLAAVVSVASPATDKSG